MPDHPPAKRISQNTLRSYIRKTEYRLAGMTSLRSNALVTTGGREDWVFTELNRDIGLLEERLAMLRKQLAVLVQRKSP